MSFIEDIKTDQRTQMLVAGMVFFALVFPTYFYIAAGDVDDSYNIGGPVGNYAVNGTFSYHEIGSGSEQIQHEGTATVGANSDAGGVDDLNIVGFRITTSHTDDESGGGPQCIGVQTQDDTVSVSGGIGENNTSNSGTESPMESSQLFITDILGTILVDVSSSEIDEILNGGTTGIGEYSFEIGVIVNKGNRPSCNMQDEGETVDWKIELISLEYSYEMVEAEEESE